MFMIKSTIRHLLDGAAKRLLGPTSRGWITLYGNDQEAPAQKPPETDTPTQTNTPPQWETWLKPLGLSLAFHDKHAICTRRGHQLHVDLDETDVETTDKAAQRRLWSTLIAARLVLDANALEYTAEMERARLPDQIWRKEDIPPEHGERFPWIVPVELVEVYKMFTGEALWAEPYLEEELRMIYVQEFGHHWHAMTANQANTHPLGLEKLRTDARRTLFYQSYKVRPSKRVKTAHGTIKYYETVEGLGASRLHLLPDYDYDAARANGFCAIPSRHLLMVAQPSGDREALEAIFKTHVEKAYETQHWPLHSKVYPFGQEGLER